MSIRLISKEQKELVTQNIRLVYHIVNKLYDDTGDHDEMVSIGTIGLIKAASTFDKEKGWKFATYATSCIRNEIFMYFRKANKYANVISLEKSINEDKDGNELMLDDMLEDTTSNFEQEIGEREILERYINIILNLLEPRERIIMLYKMAGITQPCIAKILNLSQSYISRLEGKIKEKIKEYFITLQYFKEVYSMSIAGDLYKISFSSKDVMNFNSIFAKFLQNLTSAENLPDFKVICNKERVIIHVPAHPESFSFIAQILEKIDDYNLTFIADASNISENQSVSKKVKSDEVEKAIQETVIEEKKQIISDNLSTSNEGDKGSPTDTESVVKMGTNTRQVRDYMLSKETFSFKELKEHFSHIKAGTIAFIVNDAKNNGLIISTGRGTYATKKD